VGVRLCRFEVLDEVLLGIVFHMTFLNTSLARGEDLVGMDVPCKQILRKVSAIAQPRPSLISGTVVSIIVAAVKLAAIEATEVSPLEPGTSSDGFAEREMEGIWFWMSRMSCTLDTCSMQS